MMVTSKPEDGYLYFCLLHLQSFSSGQLLKLMITLWKA